MALALSTLNLKTGRLLCKNRLALFYGLPYLSYIYFIKSYCLFKTSFLPKTEKRNFNYVNKNLDVKISRWREQPHVFGHGNSRDEVKTTFYQRANKNHTFYCYPGYCYLGVSAMMLEVTGSAMAGSEQQRRTELR